MTDLKADIFEKQLTHSYQASFRVVTFNAVGDSTKSYLVRPLGERQAVDAQSAGELRRVQGEKETLVTKLDWEFQGNENKRDDPFFAQLQAETVGPIHHLDEPDAFEHP